jgi:UDP-glucose 4-epimerase
MIAVTGASGHLGQFIVQTLTQNGQAVLCISRSPATSPSILGVSWPGDVYAQPADLTSNDFMDALGPYLGQIEGWVHSAAFIPENTADNQPEDTVQLLSHNVHGSIRLLRALARAPLLQSLVYISSFEVYGTPQSDIISELHPALPLTFYGATKLIGEKYLHLYGDLHDLPVCSLRLPAVYGPGDRLKRAVGNFIHRAVEGHPLSIQGDGEDRRDLVYAEDAAEAVYLALVRKARGIFNIGNGNSYRIRDIAEAVRTVAERPVDIEYHERVKSRLDYNIDTRRARDVLGWSPKTSLVDGVRRQYQWVLHERQYKRTENRTE